MKDRVPKYPGRVRLTPVSGQADLYDMVRADEPVEVGTALNKAALLSDATAGKYGLGSSATVNSVLDKLSGGVLIGSKKMLVRHSTFGILMDNKIMINDIAAFGGFFYIIGNDTNSDTGYVLRSNDGAEWELYATYRNEYLTVMFASSRYLYFTGRMTVSPYVNYLHRINVNGKDELVASSTNLGGSVTCNSSGSTIVSVSGSYVLYSENYGGSWISKPVEISTSYASSVAYGNGKYVTIDQDGANICYSTSASGPWTKVALPSGAKSGPFVSFANGKFYCSGSGKATYYSTNAINWYQANFNSTNTGFRRVVYDSENGQYFAASESAYILKSSDGITFSDFTTVGTGRSSRYIATQNGITVSIDLAIRNDTYDSVRIAQYVGLKDMKGKHIYPWAGASTSIGTLAALLNQRTQQDITDLQLSDIEQGQALTDLELMIMEGQANV